MKTFGGCIHKIRHCSDTVLLIQISQHFAHMNELSFIKHLQGNGILHFIGDEMEVLKELWANFKLECCQLNF